MIAQLAHVNGVGGTASSPATALDVVFREHHQAVFRAAFRITGNVADAEDVLQTVFLNLLRRASAYEALPGGDRTGRYLARAAVNAALDLLRSRKPTTDVDAVPEPVAAADNDDAVLRSELRARLRAALSQLAPRSAEMVALRYFEGCGNGEIAAALNTTASTVAVTLHRARQRLRAHLGGLEIEDEQHEQE